MILPQGCVDVGNTICPIANKCLRRESAICAPNGVTLLVNMYDYKNNCCEYFIERENNESNTQ